MIKNDRYIVTGSEVAHTRQQYLSIATVKLPHKQYDVILSYLKGNATARGKSDYSQYMSLDNQRQHLVSQNE